MGLPLTSGPVALFLALDHGPGFAASAAAGSLAGALAEIAFCLAYGGFARHGWPVAVLAASAAFAAAAAVVQHATLAPAVLAAAVVVALAAALSLLPRGHGGPAPAPPPRWDLPARMAITTALVVGITGAAATLGPRLSGVLASFPVYATILTVFAHRAGAGPAVQVLRGLLLGLFAYAGFFVVLGALIERVGIPAAFGLATATAVAIQAASLALVLLRAGSGKLERSHSGT